MALDNLWVASLGVAGWVLTGYGCGLTLSLHDLPVPWLQVLDVYPYPQGLPAGSRIHLHILQQYKVHMIEGYNKKERYCSATAPSSYDVGAGKW